MANMNPVVWFEIYVQDIERARKFYGSVFGFEFSELTDPTADQVKMLSFTPMDGSSMTQPGTAGALVQMDGLSSGGNSTLVYFGSEDCSVQEARVSEAGGSVVKPKFSIGDYGFVCLCTDTEGNLFGIHSMN